MACTAVGCEARPLIGAVLRRSTGDLRSSDASTAASTCFWCATPMPPPSDDHRHKTDGLPAVEEAPRRGSLSQRHEPRRSRRLGGAARLRSGVAAGEEELRTRWSGVEKLSGRRSIGARGSLAQAAARVHSPPSVPDGARDSVALETHTEPSSDGTRCLAAMRSGISSGWTRLRSGEGFLGGLLLEALPGDHLIRTRWCSDPRHYRANER
jgi:hypothetical protein